MEVDCGVSHSQLWEAGRISFKDIVQNPLYSQLQCWCQKRSVDCDAAPLYSRLMFMLVHEVAVPILSPLLHEYTQCVEYLATCNRLSDANRPIMHCVFLRCWPRWMSAPAREVYTILHTFSRRVFCFRCSSVPFYQPAPSDCGFIETAPTPHHAH